MRALLAALVLATGAAVLVVVAAPASAVETADCTEPELPVVIEADVVTFPGRKPDASGLKAMW